MSARSYKVEVQTFSCGPDDWTANGLRFATEEDAKLYGRDLFCRWMAVKEWRVAESNDPVTEKTGTTEVK